MPRQKNVTEAEEYNIEVEDLVDDVDATEPKVNPTPSDPKWTDFVLSHLEDDEKIDGNPTTDGLRRLVELLVGEIVESHAEPIKVEPRWATVKHTIVIASFDGVLRKYTEVADVNEENTPEMFLRYPTATASTRAEGRAYRKAMKLKRVLAAEEVMSGVQGASYTPSTPAVNDPTKMDSVQANMLNAIFARTNVNGWKYINEVLSYIAPNDKYEWLNDIPKEYVSVISEHVQKYQQIDPKTGKLHEVPKEFLGYSADFLTKWSGVL